MKAEEGMNANQGKVYINSCLTAALRDHRLSLGALHSSLHCSARSSCLLPWTLCTMP